MHWGCRWVHVPMKPRVKIALESDSLAQGVTAVLIAAARPIALIMRNVSIKASCIIVALGLGSLVEDLKWLRVGEVAMIVPNAMKRYEDFKGLFLSA
jgi:hypothetical protein